MRSRVRPRRTPQQDRSRTTVDAILQAAAHLLIRRGWSASTTNHIAERAGVSIGSLYKYFPNKASILAAVARRRIDDEVTALVGAMSVPTSEPRSTLERIVREMTDRYVVSAALDTALLKHIGTLELAGHLRAAESEVVRHTAAFLGRHADFAGGEAAAFILVHALRGVLVAAAAQSPELLRSEDFRAQLVQVAEGHASRGRSSGDATSAPGPRTAG